MVRLVRLLLLSVLVSLCALSSAIAESAKSPARVLLVLALDVSSSVSTPRWHVQKHGYARAFEDPEIREILLGGGSTPVVVSIVQWANPLDQAVAIPWTALDSPDAIRAFVKKLDEMRRLISGVTGLGGALRFSTELLESAPYSAVRKVIDISGDGEENSSAMLHGVSTDLLTSRAYALSKGITINGLPIGGGGYQLTTHCRQATNLAAYYEQCVIGGPGSFSIFVKNGNSLEEFTKAMREKLIRELSS